MTTSGHDRLRELLDAVLEGTDGPADLTYAAHRRQMVRRMLTAASREVDHGDPIMWLRAERGQTQ